MMHRNLTKYGNELQNSQVTKKRKLEAGESAFSEDKTLVSISLRLSSSGGLTDVRCPC